MDVFVTISKLITEFFGAAFNLSLPPTTHIIDGSEGFIRSLVYQNGSGEILIIHRLSPLAKWQRPWAARAWPPSCMTM
jgi:hypothetical protein